MGWKQDYLERAITIANMDEKNLDWYKADQALEEDILGKLSIRQCCELWDFAESIPSIGARLLLHYLPSNLPSKIS